MESNIKEPNGCDLRYEAQQVYEQTGLTPKKLKEERDKLWEENGSIIEAAQKVIKMIGKYVDVKQSPHPLETAVKSLKKLTGEGVWENALGSNKKKLKNQNKTGEEK